MPDLFIKDARVLTLSDVVPDYDRASIYVSSGQIVDVAPDPPDPVPVPGLRVIDGRGMLAMPGLVNGHYHSHGSFTKGAVPNLPLELFMLYAAPPFMSEPVSDRFAYVRTLLGVAAMLKQGVTAVHDDAFFLPRITSGELASVITAYGDSGIRASVTLDQANVVEYESYPFLAEILPAEVRARMEAVPRMSDQELIAIYEDFIARWHGAAVGRISAAVSCLAPQRVTPSYLRALGDLSERYRLPFSMHLLTTRLERVLGQEKLGGRSLVRYVDELGVLTENTVVVDAIWVDDEDLALMGASGCSVAHNPVSNLRLGSGVMPFRRIRDAGINICLGTDDANLDDGVNLWTTMKLAGLIHNITTPDFRQWPGADEIVHAATAGGAHAMLMGADTGQLTPGFEADLILIDLDALPFVPLADLRRHLVYGEPGPAVKMTIVGGEVVMEDGRLVRFDEQEIKAEARELATELASYVASRRGGVEELAPFYDRMYERANAEAVPMNRWAGPLIP